MRLNVSLPRLKMLKDYILQLPTLAGLRPYTKRKEDGA